MECRVAAATTAASSPSGSRNDASWRRSKGPAILLAAAALAVAPQILRGNSCGDDFAMHLTSWLDCAQAWQHGIFYPHWTPSPNWGAGEPRFVFYPPLIWMAGALLGLLFSWHAAPILLTFLCLAGTGLATRALALEACTETVATLAGCAAMFSGYALFTAYERTAFPESTGGAWLPLLLLFALRERNPSAGFLRRALDGSTAPLALTVAACWLSNAPLGVIASYLLAAAALLAATVRRSWAPILRATVGMGVGLGFCALYWIPAAYEQRWVNIQQATQVSWFNFENNWLFARHSDPSMAIHDQELHSASVIAISMIAVALVCLVIAWRRGTLPAQKSTGSRLWWIPLAAIPCIVLFLLFPISRPVWQFLPRLQFLQFPWRWMEAVEAPMAIFFAAAVWPASLRARRAVAVVCAAGFICITVYVAGLRLFRVCYPENSVAARVAGQRADTGAQGMYEYEPPQADIDMVAIGLPAACLVSNPATVLGRLNEDSGNMRWNAAQGSCLATFAWSGGHQRNPEHLRMLAPTPHSGWLVLRLLSFPAWRVQVNGRDLTSLPRRQDGLIAIPVPAGPVDLRIDWTTSPDVLAGRWVSLLGLLALTGIALLERKLRQSQVS